MRERKINTAEEEVVKEKGKEEERDYMNPQSQVLGNEIQKRR